MQPPTQLTLQPTAAIKLLKNEPRDTNNSNSDNSNAMPPPPPRGGAQVDLTAPQIQPHATRFPQSHHFNQYLLAHKDAAVSRESYERSHTASEYSDGNRRREGKYGFVEMTPVIIAGTEECGSPIMTYGEIGATPIPVFRETTAKVQGHLRELMQEDGVKDTYQIREEDGRERLGRSLAEKKAGATPGRAMPRKEGALFPAGKKRAGGLGGRGTRASILRRRRRACFVAAPGPRSSAGCPRPTPT